jgi:hypothetical protein
MHLGGTLQMTSTEENNESLAESKINCVLQNLMREEEVHAYVSCK